MRGTRRGHFPGPIADVHPRACGNTPGRSGAYRPRPVHPGMRGTQVQGPPVASCGTVHPRACGEHFRPVLAARAFTGHPRACGEHSRNTRGVWIRCGPSPRMRGTRSPQSSTGPPRGPSRACGEHLVLCWPRLGPGGPSRACGEHAGGLGALHRHLVHPRACGEHYTRAREDQADYGPSPRMRGTLSRPMDLRRDSVHPGACGEHSAMAGTRWATAGPSRACGEHGQGDAK